MSIVVGSPSVSHRAFIVARISSPAASVRDTLVAPLPSGGRGRLVFRPLHRVRQYRADLLQPGQGFLRAVGSSWFSRTACGHGGKAPLARSLIAASPARWGQARRRARGGGTTMKSVRIGNGCGFWGDNLDAPIVLAEKGRSGLSHAGVSGRTHHVDPGAATAARTRRPATPATSSTCWNASRRFLKVSPVSKSSPTPAA